MSAQPKLRGGKPSELTRLKKLWLGLADDARAYWQELFCSDSTQAENRRLLAVKLKVNLSRDNQLTEFRSWLDAQTQRELMAEKIEERKQELLSGGMTLEQAQDVLLAEASAYSVASRDFKLGVKVSSEISKKSSAKLDEEKFKEGLRTKLESGLAELATHIKANPKAQAAYEALKAEVKLATK